MKEPIKISCIIPTFNEAPRIRKVLEIVADHPLVTEVVVIDDGSTDNTGTIVTEFQNVKLFTQAKNGGKSAAIHRGVQEATGSHLLFLDADLIGLTKENITDLIQPVIDQRAYVTISLRGNSPALWRMIGLDYISGERVFPNEMIITELDKILTLPKFGLEVFLNSLIIKNKYKVAVVPWKNVSSPYKYKKVGLWKGIRGEIRMVDDIFKTISFCGPVIQIVQILKLKV